MPLFSKHKSRPQGALLHYTLTLRSHRPQIPFHSQLPTMRAAKIAAFFPETAELGLARGEIFLGSISRALPPRADGVSLLCEPSHKASSTRRVHQRNACDCGVKTCRHLPNTNPAHKGLFPLHAHIAQPPTANPLPLSIFHPASSQNRCVFPRNCGTWANRRACSCSFEVPRHLPSLGAC